MKKEFNLNPEINEKRLERRIMQSKSPAPRFVKKLTKECIEDGEINPKGIYGFFKPRFYEDFIKIDSEKFYGKYLKEKYSFAEEIGFFIVTIGEDIENKSKKEAQKKDFLKMWIYDSIGSEYVESTAKKLHELIEIEKGYKMHRSSPGYNDWDIKEQKKLFRLLPGEEIGVTLTKSGLMIPKKSISGIIGESTGK